MVVDRSAPKGSRLTAYSQGAKDNISVSWTIQGEPPNCTDLVVTSEGIHHNHGNSSHKRKESKEKCNPFQEMEIQGMTFAELAQILCSRVKEGKELSMAICRIGCRARWFFWRLGPFPKFCYHFFGRVCLEEIWDATAHEKIAHCAARFETPKGLQIHRKQDQRSITLRIFL